ncbi:MAG: phytanoyl-CoA dioxygenase family protein [Halioglobus sp.]|jgi:ectoine hydroxylase-related dioxygenase (phytanoyl-CoA dioxygenase family)|tara:strand:- start:131 stop:961 length:831 start_codon:yes stop_codon:yes gene_type:complete
MATPQRIIKAINEPYLLTSDDVQAFRENGYIHLAGVLPDDVLEYYEPIISKITQEHDPAAGVALEDKDLYGKAFIQLGNLWQHDAQVTELVFCKRLARLASELIGTQGVRLYHDQSLYKEPSGGITPWHVDQQYWPMDSSKNVTAWIPLQSTPVEMGPLCFGRGSHLKYIARDVKISDESERIIAQAIKKEKIIEIQVPYALGDVSFHSGWTLHRAGGNATEQPRKAHTIIYMDEQMRLKKRRSQNQENDRISWCGDTADGGVIDGPLTPILYRAD